MTGWAVSTLELHTGRSVRVYGLYPRNRKQLRRARELADAMQAAGLPAWVEEEK